MILFKEINISVLKESFVGCGFFKLLLKSYLKFIVLSFLFFGGPVSLSSQLTSDIQQWAEEVASTYAGELEAQDMTLFVEDLLSLARNPLNINTADREQLERIFFLTDIQIENILFKRYVNGPFVSIYELQAVEGLPVRTIKMLQPVVFIGDADTEERPVRIWGDAFFRGEYQIEKAEGFKTDKSGEKAFVGNRYKLYNRTEIESNKGFSSGFIAEKDPGEPIFNKYLKGPDMMTGYLHFSKSDFLLREAVVGQYRVSAGQGLVMQSGMPLRKSSVTTNLRNRRAAFRPSLSASESSGMRGGYFTIGERNFEFSPFISYRKKDGRIKGDSCLTSLKNDGLHRTEKELAMRHNVNELAGGARVKYAGRFVMLEAGYLLYGIDPPLCPQSYPYNMFSFRGKKVENNWLSYMISRNKVLMFGEFATDGFRRFAFSNGLIWNPVPVFSMAIGHRLTEKEYRAPLAGPMSEGSNFSGEEGLYAGIKWELSQGINISSYLDTYRFRWLKNRLDAPSEGFDFLISCEKNFGDQTILTLRYRHREKPTNVDLGMPEKVIGNEVYDQIKLQYRQSISPGWQFTTLCQYNVVDKNDHVEKGNLLAQDVKWRSQNEKLTITGRLALFSATDFLARSYAYEPHVLYMFSVPAYSGDGTRYLLLLNYKLLDNLHFWFRGARWMYANRNETGTGNSLVTSGNKTNITFQLRVKF